MRVRESGVNPLSALSWGRGSLWVNHHGKWGDGVRRTWVLTGDAVRQNAIRAVQGAEEGMAVTIAERSRTLDQNAAMWPILEAFSKQLKWPVNGQMTTLEPEEWKDILTAAFRRESARVAHGLNGGVVMLGSRTSEFRKDEFSEWLDFLHMVAADRGVELLEVTA